MKERPTRRARAAPTYRDKALITTILQSGMGVMEIRNLNYGDVRKELADDKLPVLLKPIRQKNSVEFKTLLGADAVKFLRLYLETRGELKDEAPLFTKWRSESRIKEGAIETRLREIAKGLDFIEVRDQEFSPARPHSLRAAFRSRLTGKTDSDLIKFWMGDELGPKAGAYLNLPDEDHRKIYAGVEKYLSIETTSEQVKAGEIKNRTAVDRATLDRLNSLENDNRTLRNMVEEMADRAKEMDEVLQMITNRLVWLEGGEGEGEPPVMSKEDYDNYRKKARELKKRLELKETSA